MKAKDLKIGSPIYCPDSERIVTLRVIGLKRKGDDVEISLSGYESDKIVPMEANAIILGDSICNRRLYFSVADAQKRQTRIREQRIEDAKRALEKAAHAYAITYAKYHDIQPTEPIE